MSAPDTKKSGLAEVAIGEDQSDSFATKLSNVINSREAVIRLSNQAVPLRTAQSLLKLKKTLDVLGTSFSESRDALAAEKGTPAGPQKWKLEPAQLEEFQAGIMKLLDEEVQIPQDARISLGDLSEVRLSAVDLEALTYLFEN